MTPRGKISAVSCFLLVQALFLAAAARAGGQKANPLAMPSLLRSLQIGMTEVELHKARPGAERFELLGEPAVKGDDPDPLYTEIIESPFFETVSYLFCERRLCAVTLAAVGEGEAFSHRQAKIAQGAMRKWGDRPERLLSLGANQEREIRQRKRGALLWKEGSFRVLFTFAPVSKAEPGDAALTVMDLDRLPEDLQASFLQSLTAVVPGQDQGLFAPLEIQVVPPLFE